MSRGSRPGPGKRAIGARAVRSSAPVAELLGRARDGEREALNLLLEKQLEPLKEWASRRLPLGMRDAVDIDNLVMQSVLHMVRNEPEFLPTTDGAIETHLRQLLLNRIRTVGSGDDDSRETASDQAHRVSVLETTIGHKELDGYDSALARLAADRWLARSFLK